MTPDCSTYIHDHLAGSVAAVSLIDDLLAGVLDLSLKSALTRLRSEIEEEQQVLRRLLSAAGVPEETAKEGVAWLVGKFSRVKLGAPAQDGNYLPIIQALEMLYLGITGKWLGWRILGATLQPELAALGIDIKLLQLQALAQRDLIEHHRLAYAPRSFSEVPS